MCRALSWFLCLLVFASSAPAQKSSQQPPQQPHRRQDAIRYVSRAQLGRGVTMAKLSNGLTAIVRINRAAPVATVRCYVKNTGGAFEGRYLGMGLSHVLEHLVAGGSTTTRPETEIQAIINSLGGRSNAFTSDGLTGYYIDCPAKDAAVAIDVVGDWMQNAAFIDKEYKRELGVVQRELEMGETQRNRVGYLTMKSLVFTEHPMRHPTIGYLSLLQSITREVVRDFYKSRYVPQNMTFVVVGDVDTDKVLKQINKVFAKFHRTTDTSPVLPDEPDQASPRSARLEMEGPTTSLTVAWPTVRLQHPDLYALDTASYLLTNGDSSRLARRLKIERPLATSVDSASYTPGFVKGWFEIGVECAPKNVAACRKIIFEEVARLQRELVSEQELNKVKRQTAAAHVFAQQTVQSQADALGRSHISTGDPLFDDQYIRGLQRVTPQQVRAVARRYFRPEKQNTVRIDPIGVRAKSVADAGAKEESDVVRKQLPNGLTVLIKRNAVQPVVISHVFAKGGVIADTPENSGLAALTATMMTRGTKKFSGRQISEFFDSIGGSLGVTSQRNTCYLECSVLKGDFPAALERIEQVLTAPTFPEAEFKNFQKQQLNRIAARAGNAQADILDLFVDRLPKESPYSRRTLGKAETVRDLTPADCARMHRKLFQPRNMVLSIYGDVQPDRLLKEITARFGKLEDSDTPPPTVSFESSHRQPLKPATHRVARRRAQSAMLLMGYSTVSIRDERTMAALDVFKAVMTSPGAGRLFRELRGQRLVYYVFGFDLTGFAPGYHLMLSQTRPEAVQEVIKRIEANLAKVAEEGIPADELKRAKHMLKVRHAMSGATPRDQSFEAALDELYGRGYDYRRSYDARIDAVSSDDIKRLVRKYLRDPLVVITAPEGDPK